MIARKHILIARRGQTKLLKWICCEQQAPEACTDAQRDDEHAGGFPCVQLLSTSNGVSVGPWHDPPVIPLIACQIETHNSPVLMRVFSVHGPRHVWSHAVDNFVDHRLS